MISSTWLMVGLDLTMIAYSTWVLGQAGVSRRQQTTVVGGLVAWLAALHLGLSTAAIFPAAISGPAFLGVIFAAVGGVGALLFGLPPLRRLLFGIDQNSLMMFQGIRVLFGATFLMWASVGVLPQTFGVIDGYTHIGAGFFGLLAATQKRGTRAIWFANLFGLTDILIVASTLALVLLPELGPHHPMMYAVFLPAPLWLWFHVVSIHKLLVAQSDAQGALV